MLFFKHEWAASLLHPFLIARQDGTHRIFWLHRKPLLTRCQKRARRQPDKIHRVGVQAGLIEVVNSPHQTAVGISPGAEVFYVEIADGQNAWNVL